ncbi:hypothetical protein L0222_12200 [bacterium]|nr:hypothetical protein [bacterium]MCI0602366.1 hypothetical protein [bacterium]
MKAISRVLLLLLFAARAYAQEDPLAPAMAPLAPKPTSIKVHDMENLTISALRREFPRLSGIFASAHSCRLPDYGPLISVTIQLPSFYFTKPVLQELDRRQRAAAEQARKVRTQLERAAQLISLRSKEAGLLERIDWEESSKKKSKETLEALQNQLSDVRKDLETLETNQLGTFVVQESNMLLNEVDLNKMLVANYQQLVQRVTKTMKNSLAENGPLITDLNSHERVTVNAYIRDNILGSSGKSILFSLYPQDIQDYKNGTIDLKVLRDRVIVRDEPRE